MDGPSQWDEQVSQLFVLPLGLPLIVNIVWHWMHCYQASKVDGHNSHFLELLFQASCQLLSLLRLLISKVIFAATKAGNVRPDSLPETTVPWGTMGHSMGSWKPQQGTPQLWLQAWSLPVTLVCLSFRTMVKHFNQPGSHEFPYPGFHYENL